MTSNRELFKLSLNNLKERKLRSWLTMIGIFIGITAVVALISMGEGKLRIVTHLDFTDQMLSKFIEVIEKI